MRYGEVLTLESMDTFYNGKIIKEGFSMCLLCALIGVSNVLHKEA